MRSLGSQVRLDARTKLLNPKWYEGMLSSGYEGVREIQKRLTNTVGWSATSGAVDNWVYDEVRILCSCWRRALGCSTRRCACRGSDTLCTVLHGGPLRCLLTARQANSTYMEDPEMAKRLMETNPNSFRKLVATFLEANGRGYWDAAPDQIERLRELYMDVEDKIEGVE